MQTSVSLWPNAVAAAATVCDKWIMMSWRNFLDIIVAFHSQVKGWRPIEMLMWEKSAYQWIPLKLNDKWQRNFSSFLPVKINDFINSNPIRMEPFDFNRFGREKKEHFSFRCELLLDLIAIKKPSFIIVLTAQYTFDAAKQRPKNGRNNAVFGAQQSGWIFICSFNNFIPLARTKWKLIVQKLIKKFPMWQWKQFSANAIARSL